MKVQLQFGALSPSIAQQLAMQGVSYQNNHANHWQKDADAITRLSVRGLLTDSGVTAARRRPLKNILHYTRKVAAA